MSQNTGKRKRTPSIAKSPPAKRQATSVLPPVHEEQDCGNCNAKKTFMFCTSCNCFICGACEPIHSSFISSRTHPELINRNESNGIIQCPNHKSLCDRYCETCKRVICASCDNHEKHSQKKLSDFVKDQKETVQKATVSQIIGDDDTLETQVKDAKEEVNKLEKQLYKLEKQLEVKTVLNKYKNQLIESFVDKYPAKDLLSNDKNRTEKCVKAIKKVINSDLKQRQFIFFKCQNDIADKIRCCKIDIQDCSITNLKAQIKTKLGLEICKFHDWENEWFIDPKKLKKFTEGKLLIFSPQGCVGQEQTDGKIVLFDPNSPLGIKFSFIFQTKKSQ